MQVHVRAQVQESWGGEGQGGRGPGQVPPRNVEGGVSQIYIQS